MKATDVSWGDFEPIGGLYIYGEGRACFPIALVLTTLRGGAVTVTMEELFCSEGRPEQKDRVEETDMYKYVFTLIKCYILYMPIQRSMFPFM